MLFRINLTQWKFVLLQIVLILKRKIEHIDCSRIYTSITKKRNTIWEEGYHIQM
jgi:hypothetical protein